MFNDLLSENRVIYEILCKNVVETDTEHIIM